MPIIVRHLVHPIRTPLATILFINIYRTPVSGVFRRKDSGFAVCGENLASISQFVAGKRHARLLTPRLGSPVAGRRCTSEALFPLFPDKSVNALSDRYRPAMLKPTRGFVPCELKGFKI